MAEKVERGRPCIAAPATPRHNKRVTLLLTEADYKRMEAHAVKWEEHVAAWIRRVAIREALQLPPLRKRRAR